MGSWIGFQIRENPQNKSIDESSLFLGKKESERERNEK